MLTLYAFLIFALGSSVIATPTHAELHEARLLKDDKDPRLLASKWGRLLVRESEPGQALPDPTWTEAAPCDDFLELVRGRIIGGLKINVHRVVRRLENPGNTYVVDRGEDGNGRTKLVYPEVPSTEWMRFLENTYWGREPDIVGKVSDWCIDL